MDVRKVDVVGIELRSSNIGMGREGKNGKVTGKGLEMDAGDR